MTENIYRHKCAALFDKAKNLGLSLKFYQDNFNHKRLNCLWYGGFLAEIVVNPTLSIILKISGDVRAFLRNKNTNAIIAMVKDKTCSGKFTEEMHPFIKTDAQLFERIENGSLELCENNWIEYNGILNANGKEMFVDLGFVTDNVLDNNILVAINQALDNYITIVEDIKAFSSEAIPRHKSC